MKKLLFILTLFFALNVSAQDTLFTNRGKGFLGTTVGANFLGLTNPSAVAFPRINADNSLSALSASAMYTALGGFDGKLSSLLAATGNNSIDNAATIQTWNWSSFTNGGSSGAFNLTSNSTVKQGAFKLLNLSNSGVQTNSSVTLYTVGISATNTGTGITNQALLLNAVGGANNYAMTVQAGNVGMGGNLAPTAWLHIGAGTATAGTAPLKFTSGTPTTTPEIGAVHFNNGLWMLDSSNSVRDTIATRSWARNNISGGGGSTGLTVGTTTIASGTTTKVLYDNGGVLGEYTVTGSGNAVLGTSPTITSPTYSGTAAPAYVQGKLTYDTDNESLTFFNNDNAIGLQIGQEEWIRVKNVSGSTIANGAAVYISGANSGYPTIALAQSNSSTTTIGIGLTTESIANNAIGYVTVMGVVHGLNTAGFTAGLPVFIDPSTPGALTQTAPSAPNYRYRVGIVAVSDATVGTIHVTPSTASLGNGTANQLFGMNTAGTAQEVKSILGTTGNIGITNATNSITINSGPLLARQDANKVLGVVNIDSAYTTTPTAAGTTTLTAASTHDQYFTGSTTQIVVLPAANTFIAGREYYIVNKSSGVVTVNYNGGSLAQTIAANTFAYFKATDVSTSTGVWDVQYSLIPLTTGISGILPAANGGTGVANSSTITLGGALVTSGAFSTTFTATGTTTVTLPTTGTLYGTATGSVTSAQLLGSMSDETGTGALVFANTPTLVTPVLGVATATSINKVTITQPTTTATLTLITGSSLITAGAFALTLTSTATSNATIPAGTNTLYSTLAASITSAQMLSSVSDETGTGVLVFGTSPAFTTSVTTASTTFTLFNTGATTLNFGGAATTFTLGGTPTTSLSVTLFGNSTASAANKGITVGSGGVSGSITDIQFGSNISGATSLVRVFGRYNQAVGYFTPTTGGTVTAVLGANVIEPAGTLAALTVTLPANPVDGDNYSFTFTQIITALTFNGGSSATFVNPITSSAAAGKVTWQYRAANTSFYQK